MLSVGRRECAGDAERARARGDDSVATAVKEARVIGGELLFAASTREDASKMPEARVLGADARTCAAAARDDEVRRRAARRVRKVRCRGRRARDIARGGFTVAALWVGSSDARSERERRRGVRRESRGAAEGRRSRARAHFKQLLASNSFDKVASERIRELSRAEEVWLTPRYGGKPDQAYLMADAVVRFALRAASFFASFAILYCFRGVSRVQSRVETGSKSVVD